MTTEARWKAMIEAIWEALGVGALAVVAAACSEPRGSSLGRWGDEALRAEPLVWGGEQRLEAGDAAEYDQLGYSVSLADDRALVGAYGESFYRGAAYVFVRNGSSWTEEQKLVPSDGAEGDDFGWSVSLTDDRALVGAYGKDSTRGAAYVFVRSGSSWTEEQKLVAGDGVEGDDFGWSVSLTEDRALVGAYGKDDARGAAYVFVRSDGAWNEEQRLEASDGALDDKLGYSVSLADDSALVGAIGTNTTRGAAYVFAASGSSWTEQQKLEASDGAADDHFGVSVSLTGDRALAGAYWDDSLRGAAYVFVRSGRSWTEEQKLVASDGDEGHRFGNSVSLGADRALIGEYANDAARGAAYVFVRSDSSWTEEQKLVASDAAEGDDFGWSVSLAADRTLIGAPFDDNLRGAAYVYSLACQSDADCPDVRHCAADQTCQPRKGQSETSDDLPATQDDSGCACRTAGGAPRERTWPSAALGVLAVTRRRRRRRNARNPSTARPARAGAVLGSVVASVLAIGCASGGVSGDDTPGSGARAGTGATGSGGSGAASGASACAGTRVTTAKRVVRLTEHQLFNAYTAIFGATAAATITANEDPPSLAEREFPPISGEIGVSESLFALYDRLAQSAMRYVSANAAKLTGCGATPSDADCVQHYLLSFAEKAFRHPLSEEERTAIVGRFWTEMNEAGANVADALGYGVYGVLSAPSFMYRTELGADVTVDGPLTPYELATAVSMFLTDRPPDAELLAAAAANQLGTPDRVRAEVTRILATPEARQNLESAFIKYFTLGKANAVILNEEAAPDLAITQGLLSSIAHEGELFMRNVLWSGPLSHLLISRKTWTSAEVATRIYGVTPPGDVDPDGFGLVELPADRSGLLTLSTFLTAGARPTGGSPVTRGLAVNGAILCGVNPPFPEVINPVTGQSEPDPEVAAAIAALADKSELERAQYRATTPTCAGCHLDFDAFGMVLEPYDAVGRFRTTDLAGRPIDATWTTVVLPDSAGGATVTNAADAARAIAASGAFERCLAMNLINYALTEVSRGGANNTVGQPTASCSVESVIGAFSVTDGSAASLIREIAASETLAVRSKGL